MSSEKVLELSVEETNKLRADLGLAPLRLESNIINQQDAVVVLPSQHNAGTASSSSEQRQEELLEISVNDTNALRAKLGLSALRQGDSASKKAIVHAPAENESERKQAAERIERAKLQRQVEQGISRFQNQESLGAQEASAKSWAAQMRSQTTAPKPEDTTVEATRRKKPLTKNGRYDETDLHGINVAHAMSELQDGSTTVMTLADGSLLKTADDISKKVVGLNDEDDFALENINLAEQQHQQEGIRQKRKMELGMGRAGGYAGFDDDEFEDLGGSQAPSRFARGGGGTGPNENATTKGKRRGFQIGAHLQDDEDGDEPDLFAAQEGKAISLEPAKADVAASDFMTSTEDEELRQSKKKKKDSKFKKKKKKDKKDKKKQRTAESDDQDEDEQVGTQPTRGLLEELEETVIDSATVQKRKRSIDEATAGGRQDDTKSIEVDDSKVDEAAKRAKFDSIIAKGNERARDAFHSKKEPIFDLDEEPDDAFLNAALAKARRLNRLREMSGTKKTSGADAIAAAVMSSRV
jgi:U4/U6.U5 tri-snRNP-associated protein 1